RVSDGVQVPATLGLARQQRLVAQEQKEVQGKLGANLSLPATRVPPPSATQRQAVGRGPAQPGLFRGPRAGGKLFRRGLEAASLPEAGGRDAVADPRPFGAGRGGLLTLLRGGPVRDRCYTTWETVSRDRGQCEVPQDCRKPNRCLRPPEV